jgi:hypothetical protein
MMILITWNSLKKLECKCHVIGLGQHLNNMNNIWINIQNNQHMIEINFKNQYIYVNFIFYKEVFSYILLHIQ